MPASAGGYRFTCDLRDSIAREVCFTGLYEPQETAIVRRILQPGDILVDVGANWGYYTLLGAHLVGDRGRVVAIEPDPRALRLLRSNVEANRLSHVVIRPLAAAERHGTTTLLGYDVRDRNFGTSRIGGPAADAPGLAVTTAPLDDVLDGVGAAEVSLLKMDVEGAEEGALRGLSRSLSTHRIQRLLVELHPGYLDQAGIPLEGLLDRVAAFGYVPWRIDHTPRATRSAAYRRHLDPSRWILPFDRRARLDAWPHLLWVREGVEPLPTPTSAR